MGDKSKIQWTDASWTPIRARNVKTGKVGWDCLKVTPGCANCYSEKMNLRLGTGMRYALKIGDNVELFLDEKMLTQPLRWKRARRVFVCSMTDLFADFVPEEWIDRVFAVMAEATTHTFQVLTKRARRMKEYVESTGDNFGRHGCYWQVPLPNVWLGVSAEDQQRLDERWPDLEATPAAVRFVSAEPLLGPLRLVHGMPQPCGCRSVGECYHNLGSELDWVIVGGESGPGARAMDIAWARDIVRQCREAGVACFIKQLGSHPRWGKYGGDSGTASEARNAGGITHSKGGDPEEWPEDLRVRKYPA